MNVKWHENSSSSLIPRLVKLTGNKLLQTALVVQWANCQPKPTRVFPGQNITFQLVLTSDLATLYALFIYPYGRSHLSEESSYPMQVGYYDGHIRHVLVSKYWLGHNQTNINLNQRYNLDQEKGNTGTHNKSIL